MTAPFTLLDGGMGRELARMGAPFRQPEWSALALLEGPAFVRRAHDSFVAAGAEVITTNSYAVVPFHLGDERFLRLGLLLADRSGRLAREAADAAGRAVRVAGSLPPLFGSYRPDLFDAARAPELLKLLVRGLGPHVDLWLAETQSCIAEAEASAAAVADDSRDLWISFTLKDEDADPARPCLRSGESIDEAVTAVLALGAKALLFNCSQPEVMTPALVAAKAALRGRSLPLGVYANAFPPQRKTATANSTVLPIRDDLTPEGYRAFATAWAEAGASLIGGCCGIGPEHIGCLHSGGH